MKMSSWTEASTASRVRRLSPSRTSLHSARAAEGRRPTREAVKARATPGERNGASERTPSRMPRGPRRGLLPVLLQSALVRERLVEGLADRDERGHRGDIAPESAGDRGAGQ